MNVLTTEKLSHLPQSSLVTRWEKSHSCRIGEISKSKEEMTKFGQIQSRDYHQFWVTIISPPLEIICALLCSQKSSNGSIDRPPATKSTKSIAYRATRVRFLALAGFDPGNITSFLGDCGGTISYNNSIWYEVWLVWLNTGMG